MIKVCSAEKFFGVPTNSPAKTDVSDGVEIYDVDTNFYDNAKSIFENVRLLKKWLSVSSFCELIEYSGDRYHILFHLNKSSASPRLIKLIEDEYHSFYKYNYFVPTKWIYLILIFFQSILYRKAGFSQIKLLKSLYDVHGELLKKGDTYFIAYHANTKDNLRKRSDKFWNYYFEQF